MASEDDTTAYIAILEGVVAVCAVKLGLNPNTMMANALQELGQAAGLGSVATQRVIEARWQGRALTATTVAAKAMVTPDEAKAQVEEGQSGPQTVEPVSMASRLAEYRERQSLTAPPETPTET